MKVPTLLSAVSAISTLLSVPVAAALSPNPPTLEFLYSLNATVGEPIEVGNGPSGERVAIPVTGGTFKGPRLSGKVLNVGAEWGVTDPNGTFRADARYQLKTDDGANIYVQLNGPSKGEGHAQSRITLETGSEEYYWLNDIVAVGVTTLGKGWVAVDAWELVSPE
ncbi:hypothetical protein ASPVEDRAFT_83362 [Aspergillus versicolor CBS 583.65]|uniref:Uncharacterized protein n=1 Tax=Aspergillus versicolor CBS 583.65 TaxID=1036611 RepID=A0A1L9PJY5_ASPVE|nr:uncharacterized protein ASPVEDRAFT_83362 [Aspergillus versicolor CBS 583.65]OJJ01839.1 hypothetical protein ASPVEDRAFT_83362 [Aspergillus versicolor CBS 583.65]